MNLAKDILNGRKQAFEALTVPDEQDEVNVVLNSTEAIVARNRAIPKGSLKLKRSFTMMGTRYWRVKCIDSPNNESDLSIEGLSEWGIL